MQPGKRPRLTTNPFILFKDGKPIMPFGTPGADVQPQAMLQFVLNVAEFGMDPQEAAEAPRLSTYSFPLTSDPHPYNPNLLKVEERMGREAFEGWRRRATTWWPGWTGTRAAGSVCGIWIDREKVSNGMSRPSGWTMWTQVFLTERTSKECASMNCMMMTRKMFS